MGHRGEHSHEGFGIVRRKNAALAHSAATVIHATAE